MDVDDQVRNATGWDVKGNAVDEPAFVGALIDKLGAVTCIDLARVFATGLSNRGAMAKHDLVTPDAGSGPPRQSFRPVLEVVQEQAKRNGCIGDPTDSTVEGIRTRTWQGCDAATVLVTLAHQGHSWPGHHYPVTRADLAANTTQEPWMTSAGRTPDTVAANMLLTTLTVDATARRWAFFMANA